MKLPKYEIFTETSCVEINQRGLSEDEYDKAIENYIAEVDETLKRVYGEEQKYFKVHFFDTPFSNDSIHYYEFDLVYGEMQNELVQCLAVKDGVELVKFENGNIGFVSYYNGNEDGCEIERCTKEEWEMEV